MAAELRWILLGLSVLLLAGIWWWGTRRSRQAPGNAQLRESPLHVPPAQAAPSERREMDSPPSDWGVPPFEPLSIRTADFDAIPMLDRPMTAGTEPENITTDFDSIAHDTSGDDTRPLKGASHGAQFGSPASTDSRSPREIEKFDDAGVWGSPVEPRFAEPTYHEPTNHEPAFVDRPIEPRFHEPTFTETAHEPAYHEPTFAKSTHREPAYHEPTFTEPTQREPARREPTFAKSTHSEPAYHEPTFTEPTHDEPAYHEPTFTEPTHLEPIDHEPTYAEPTFAELPTEPPFVQPTPELSSAELPAPPPSRAPTAPSRTPAENSGRFTSAAPQTANVSETQRIVTVRVCARPAERWAGAELMAALEKHGLSYGRYKVFHRNQSDGRTLFCAASLIEPGTFDIARMPQEEFRGLTLFAVLPGPIEPLQIIDALITTAAELAETLQGSVQDSKGLPLSAQRAEALRAEVARFQASLTMI